MRRLDFTLPDFTRLSWVSDLARDVWQPRLQRITSAWLEIEWRAVAQGVRRCSIATMTPAEFVAAGARWAEFGLSAVPLELLGVTGQPYSATPTPVVDGQPYVLRLVVGRPADAAAFRNAWDAADDDMIGDLLGYPPCCRAFFCRTWVDDRMVDTTWPMALGSLEVADSDDEMTCVEVSGPPQSNILWRWMGVRPVPHLPCRVDCPATVEFADRLIAVGRDIGFADEMDWLVEILSWPVEWSALHGIAEIKTPVLRVSTRTDATAVRYEVRRHGDRFPREGARGLSWAYHAPVRLRLTGTPGFRRGLDHSSATVTPRPSWFAGDNGFPSVEAMDAAHAPLVDVIVEILGDDGGTVIDLGCGNGALLAKVVDAVPSAVPYGIEVDPRRRAHVSEVLPGHVGSVVTGDMFDVGAVLAGGASFRVGVLMPGRLLEVEPSRAAGLRAWLDAHVEHLVVYAYGDWLERAGSLALLAEQAGFELLTADGGPVGRAVVSTVRGRNRGG